MRRIDARRGTESFKALFPTEFELLTKNHQGGPKGPPPIRSRVKASVTVLIPKKGKDKRLMDSLRPISLLNVVYKILTKALARRLSTVIQGIINEDQTGFLKGRYIGENVRLSIDVIKYAKAQTCLV